MSGRLEFIDRRTPAEQPTAIDARIAAVLQHGQFIMRPEVKELEDRPAAFAGVLAFEGDTDAGHSRVTIERRALHGNLATFPATRLPLCGKREDFLAFSEGRRKW